MDKTTNQLQNSPPSAPSKLIKIKIQTMDNSFTLSLLNTSTVLQLKEKIASIYRIPIPNQRLIFQGRLMNDNSTLSSLKVDDACVVHLVARALEDLQNPQNSQESQQEDSFPIIQIPFNSNHRRNQLLMPHFDLSECFESLYQNILSISNFQKCKKQFNSKSKDPKANAEVFDFSRSQYEVGQWLDVKDTIEQWLEGQVMEVRNRKAYIHYNGWGERWDEWIDFSSPRIRNFKVYTLQSPAASFMSPSPGVACDAGVDSSPRPVDVFFYLDQCKRWMTEIIGDISNLIQIRDKRKGMFDKGYLNENDRKILFNATQMIPLMDRCGRMLCDLSVLLSHIVINPNIYPQVLMGYERRDVFQKLKNVNNLKGSDGGKRESNSMREMYNNFRGNGLQMRNVHRQMSMSDIIGRSLSPVVERRGNFCSIQTNLGYSLLYSSNELPFIQRITASFTQSDRIISRGSGVLELIENEEAFPKINLQVPALLSPGEVMMMTGYAPFSDSNFDIYVHTIAPVREGNRNNENVNANANSNTNNNSNNTINHNNNTNTNINTNNNSNINSVINTNNNNNSNSDSNSNNHNLNSISNNNMQNHNTINSNNLNILNTGSNTEIQTLQSTHIPNRINEVLNLSQDEIDPENSNMNQIQNMNPFLTSNQLYKDEYTQTEEIK